MLGALVAEAEAEKIFAPQAAYGYFKAAGEGRVGGGCRTRLPFSRATPSSGPPTTSGCFIARSLFWSS